MTALPVMHVRSIDARTGREDVSPLTIMRNRRRDPNVRALTASAAAVNLADHERGRRISTLARWQEDAWAYRDDIGEVHYAMGFLGNVAGRMRLFPALAAPEGVDPTPLNMDDLPEGVPVQFAADCWDVIAWLAQGRSHAGQILGKLAQIFETVGEGRLVMRHLDLEATTMWDAYSMDEVRWSDTHGWHIIGSPTGKIPDAILSEDTDFVHRVWIPHPRYSQLPDSPMRPLLDVCEELLVTGRAIRSLTRSRIPAGILLMADSLKLAGEDQTEEEGEAEFIELLGQTLAGAVTDEGSPAALVPTLVRGTREDVKDGMRLLSLARPMDADLIAREARALGRLGMGLDIPPELLTGMADVNHWTAWQIAESTFRDHVEPIILVCVDALTVAAMRTTLLAQGWPRELVERAIIWYDPSDVVTKPDRGEAADAAHDRLAISDASYRRDRGYDDADAPDDAEIQRRLLYRRKPNTDTNGDIPALPAAARLAPVLALERAALPAAGTAAGQDAQAARLSRRLTGIDTTLRTRVHDAADAALSRALERAGARIRAAAQRDPALRASLAGVPVRQVAGTAGRAAVTAALGLAERDLVADAFTALAGQWGTWTDAAAEDAIDTALALAGMTRANSVVARAVGRLRDALAAAAAEGWVWLEARLVDLAVSILYDPAPLPAEPVEPGELSGSPVPLALVRGALSLAGGIAPDRHSPGPDGLAQDHLPFGGIGTGWTITQLLRSAGQAPVEYEWVYGVSVRPFVPHRDLDGLRFVGWDDDRIRTTPDTAWLGEWYRPGDHRGCHCDFVQAWADYSDAQVLRALGDATFDPAVASLLREAALADVAAGRLDTTVVEDALEAERIANARPSDPHQPTPVTDAVARAVDRQPVAAR